MILAGIDIGTNTIRLLIAEFSAGSRFNKMASKRQITRLGQDISKTGILKDEAVDRTIRVLEDFSRVCNGYPINGLYAAATSAVREASNGGDFVRMVKERTGLDVHVISGDEEARLTVLGVSSGLSLVDKDVFLMDVGGGSTEFILTSDSKILFKISTDIGVVRFTEQYLHSDPPKDGEIRLLETAIEERLKPVILSSFVSNVDHVNFIGTAGTITTLAAIEQEMAVYDPLKVNGYRMTRKGIEKIRKMLSQMTIKERKEIPALEEGREDIIIAGAIAVDKVMEWFGFQEVIVSDNGLREGLVIDLYNRLSHASCT